MFRVSRGIETLGNQVYGLTLYQTVSVSWFSMLEPTLVNHPTPIDRFYDPS